MSGEFEYVDASAIEITVRKRKPKYKHKLWEADTPKEYDRYLFAASRINKRRQVLLTGEYDVENDPHSALISARNLYEIECETVFHTDVNSVDEIAEDMHDVLIGEMSEMFDYIYGDDTDFNTVDVDELINEIYNLIERGKKFSTIEVYDFTNDMLDCITFLNNEGWDSE